ncbi:putative RNA-directed DNA polymerase from transposon BS [Trichonephila clavipes]|nr:putative RNA-directed DNA polymerase from transposon BS [Trichonephila clavipes]
MFDSSSYANPTPLAHADTSREDRTINIKNLYLPPNSQHLDTNMMEGLFDDKTIILGDFNSRNTTWGSTVTNARGLELSNLVNDKAFLRLNDGTLTFRSNSYGSTDVLYLTFISPSYFLTVPGENEKTNAIISDNDNVSVYAREAAEALAQHYANESRIAFSSSDKHFTRITRDQQVLWCFWHKGKALPWILNFLNHRNFCVNLHATFSDSYKTYQEIPQGRVLSPTLSSLFISGVKKYINPSQIRLFAGDVVLWCSDSNVTKMESQLNRSLVNIQEFADNHKIAFNASKSTVSLFSTNRHLYNCTPEIFLMTERLSYSNYHIYLGFTLDSEVNSGKHIEKIADKARKRLKATQYPKTFILTEKFFLHVLVAHIIEMLATKFQIC